MYPDQNDSEKTFEQIIEHLVETLEAHRSLLKDSQDIIKELTLIKQENQSYKSEVAYLRQEM